MKKDNKGFSLVELIVVVAIMAVLMVVVTPALLRYVEKTRLQRDNSAIAEVANAAKIACASESVNKEVSTAGGVTITIPTTKGNVTCTAIGSGSITNFTAEMEAAIGEIELTSNKYTASTGALSPVLSVTIDPNSMAVTVKGTGMEVDGTQYTTGSEYNF